MRSSKTNLPRRASVRGSGAKASLGGGLDLRDDALRVGLRRLHHRPVQSLHRGLADLDVTEK